jgi:hypothetical protein
MSDIEIYDPLAIGSDFTEKDLFHNPEVVADKIGETKHKKDKPKKKKKETKPVEVTWHDEAEKLMEHVEKKKADGIWETSMGIDFPIEPEILDTGNSKI